MIDDSALTALAGKTVHGRDGEKIGRIADVYESTDGASGTFVTVATGLFGSHVSFVPLAEAELRGDDVVVPYDKALVKDAPRVAADEELSAEEEDRLYRHYALTGAETAPGTSGAGLGAAGAAGVLGRDALDRDSDDRDTLDTGTGTARADDAMTDEATTGAAATDDAMTRSEERLRVGTQRVEAGRARLRKRIVTETQTATVRVGHEELRVEREPVAGDVRPGEFEHAFEEREIEVVLHAERPVVATETVPVERVRLDTDVVTGQETVSEQVRKEVIETEGVDDGVTDRTGTDRTGTDRTDRTGPDTDGRPRR